MFRYLALNEEARVALLTSELRNSRPLTSPFVEYSEETLGELALFHAAPRPMPGSGRIRSPMHHLDVQGMSDMLEVALLLKEAGLIHPSGRSSITSCRCSRPSRIAGLQRIMDRMLSIRDYRKLVDSCGSVQEVMLGYSDSKQRMRLRHVGLGLYKAEIGLIEVFDRHHVRLRLFHGRGGWFGRAAGRATTPSTRSRAAR